MKKLILTSVFILGSIVTLFAQANRPGSPIGGIVVKGGQNGVAGIADNPLYNPSGTATQNPMADLRVHSDMASAGAQANPYFKGKGNAGQMPAQFVAGQPIGGIVVKGGQNGKADVVVSPLYEGSNLEGASALYTGKN